MEGFAAAIEKHELHPRVMTYLVHKEGLKTNRDIRAYLQQTENIFKEIVAYVRMEDGSRIPEGRKQAARIQHWREDLEADAAAQLRRQDKGPTTADQLNVCMHTDDIDVFRKAFFQRHKVTWDGHLTPG